MAKNSTPDPNTPGLSKAAQRAARAAAANAELEARKRKEQLRRAGMYGVALVVLIAVVVVLVLVGKNKSNNAAPNPNAPAIAIGKSQYGFTVGSPSAPHTIIFYEDFLCPHCGHVERASATGLDAAAKAGKVYIEYRPFNLLSADGPYSAEAINAFQAVREIAGDDAALQFHNLLFANQPDETAIPSNAQQLFVQWADQVVPAADQQKVADAINNNAYGDFVTAATAEAEGTAGVNSTPTIYLDGALFTDASGTATGAYAPDDNMGANLVKAVQ